MDTRTRKIFEEFKAFHEGLASALPVDVTENTADRRHRLRMLEQDPEEWYKYYFPSYATAPAAQFHKDATRRVIDHAEWTEVRSWSRELAKSTRTMMDVFYLAFVGNNTGKGRRCKKNILLVSNSQNNAERLLAPYIANLEKNQRIINDYGAQKNVGSWTSTECITRTGIALRALGAGQSPRGTRNEAIRPDCILVDDLDTDEDCRNADIIDKRWNWIQEALIPTRSISNPMLIIYCGNIIAEDCCIVRAQQHADHVDVINIRDNEGHSSWPQKNTEADIDRALSQISYAAQQKEYFNNPMTVSRTFPGLKWGKCPPLSSMPFVVVYADPAPGNKDRPGARNTQGNSRKAVFIVGRQGITYYVYKGFLDVMGSDRFITSMYYCRNYIAGKCDGQALPAIYFLVENNSLQDPFYEQVYRPLIQAKGAEHGGILSVQPDTRRKPEKWFRIEATLQPLVSSGNLVLNEEEQNDEHMQRLEVQFKTAKPTSKQLDGPDCIEGAVYIINEKFNATKPSSIRSTRINRDDGKAY